jgi:hypothetical protein
MDHLLQSIDNEDGNINYYTDLTRNVPLVSQPIWPNKPYQYVTCYWIWILALFYLIST